MNRMGPGAADESARPVIGAAFALLASLRERGPARVSELQRDCALPRTTVHRLLGQLHDVGAVERVDGLWRLGPTLLDLGSGPAAEPRLYDVARRPLMELARATGALVALSVEAAGRGLVIDVLPGARPLEQREPRPGMVLRQDEFAAVGVDIARVAPVRAHRQARHGDLRPVLDPGDADPAVACAAAPFRVSRHDTGAIWLMVPGGDGLSDSAVTAARRTAGRIAADLSRSRPGAPVPRR
ncbi:helix-turn-helix domain-containing protein [Streptomyces sp. NPDC006923]|uniref:helix-turn-helix domain-containing protein n=1 Tax=Streptomyces sp. NPDC006923 TaxID=3155355 RepID=UPI0033ECCECC